MFGWLNSILGWASSGLDDLWRKVVSVFQVIYSYVDGWIVQIVKDINSVYQWVWGLIQAVEKFAQSIYTVVVSWAVVQFNKIMAWVGNLWNQLYGYAQGIVTWAARLINNVIGYFTGWITSLENWVLRDIWDPLWNFISGAIRWIQTEGAWVFYLLTHPDQLALILGRYILAAWMNLGRRYAGPLGRWMIHTMLSMSGEVAGILEDFIAGIL